MVTSEHCNEAWKRGYIDGYKKFKSGSPSIPTRPASYPPSVDPLKYYYDAGYTAGIQESYK